MKKLAELKKEDRHIIEDPNDIIRFLQGGFAEFSLYSCKTKTELKFYVETVEKHRNALYVRVDIPTESGGLRRAYIGSIGHVGIVTTLYKTKKASTDDSEFGAFSWFMRALLEKNERRLAQVKLLHHCRCSRCGRPLITKKSVTTGMGPNCTWALQQEIERAKQLAINPNYKF